MEITIALTKGRILEETISILAEAGIIPAEDISLSRKLLFDTNIKRCTHINIAKF